MQKFSLARICAAAGILSFVILLLRFSDWSARYAALPKLQPALAGSNDKAPLDGGNDDSHVKTISHHESAPTTVSTAAISDSLVLTTTTAVSSPAHSSEEPATQTPPSSKVVPEDKIVVIGKLQREEADWVAEFLPEWQHAIYTVDNTSQPFHTDVNKGREANAYLYYILHNYDNLPSTVAFLHPHRLGYPAAWHNDASNYDNVNSLKNLNIDFIQKNGYANLRCIWEPGCPEEVQPFRAPPADSTEVSTENTLADVWPEFFGLREIPKAIGTPCCAQFAVSREQIRARPLSDYKLYHDWLMRTPLSDDTSGRVFEYLWHIIFGQDPVYCPGVQQCYNDVYGGHRR